MRAAEGWSRSRIALVLAAMLLAGATAILAYPKMRAFWHHHRLVSRLHGPDVAGQLDAAIALGKLGDAQAVPALLAALDKGEAIDVRSEEEIAALCSIGNPQAIAARLEPTKRDRSPFVRALACVDNDAARAILGRALGSGDPDLVRSIAGTLSESADSKLADLLIAAASGAAPERKRLMLAAMVAPGGGPLNPRIIALLERAANDPDAAIRGAASASLRWNTLNLPGSAGEWTGGGAQPDDAATANLAEAAQRARAFIAARQDPAGYWRTSRSPAPHFERAVREKNTYLTPVIVDLLRPVATRAGLAANIAEAIKQIAGEIEPSGLVRYYGIGPGSPPRDRGCTISFDADDTALAWRVAPPEDQGRLRGALATLRRYLAPNGLYRTWLAPTDGLKCVDRGSEANPTDIGIQMHVLMFLAGAEPAAATSLCANLARSVADERIWVYYRMEPLIPMLRIDDLGGAGCSLRLPQSRMLAPIAGQGKWVAVVRALSRSLGSANRGVAISLLRRLAEDDFAAIRRAPPLLYQNDATGSIPAFYWSQEFGFALWLRLYFETAAASPA